MQHLITCQGQTSSSSSHPPPPLTRFACIRFVFNPVVNIYIYVYTLDFSTKIRRYNIYILVLRLVFYYYYYYRSSPSFYIVHTLHNARIYRMRKRRVLSENKSVCPLRNALIPGGFRFGFLYG